MEKGVSIPLSTGHDSYLSPSAKVVKIFKIAKEYEYSFAVNN